MVQITEYLMREGGSSVVALGVSKCTYEGQYNVDT